MGANEEIFGLEQSRGWHKLLEKLQIEHNKYNNNLRAATKRGDIPVANNALGWLEAIEMVRKLPSIMMQTLPKEN